MCASRPAYNPGTRMRLIELDEPQSGDRDNVTDWCLEQFQNRYGPDVSKDDIWEYMYGVMHAPDWRERYRFDLQRSLPRIPLADGFEAFRSAGRELMDLHAGYETCEEYPISAVVSTHRDFSARSAPVVTRFGLDEAGDLAAASDPDRFRISGRMRWGKEADNPRVPDRSVLWVNDRCRLVGIPPEALDYQVSGRSPLDWAIHSVRRKEDKKSKPGSNPRSSGHLKSRV